MAKKERVSSHVLNLAESQCALIRPDFRDDHMLQLFIR